MDSPQPRFLFDLNVAQEEPDEWNEPVADAPKKEEVAEPEEVIMEGEEYPMEELTVEEDAAEEEEEETTAAQAAAAEVEDEEDRVTRKMKRDYEVFVGGLPHDAAEEDVARALAEAGEVAEVSLARDPADPKLNRGFAFVRFSAAWEARWAANDLRTATVIEFHHHCARFVSRWLGRSCEFTQHSS
jgi:RNA recognition motif-containing protein